MGPADKKTALWQLLAKTAWGLAFISGMALANPVVDYEFDPVIVTANRFPASFSNLTRVVTLVDSQQLAHTPALSIADLLCAIGGVDMMRRAAHGVQGEAGVRGGSFEETLILVNGVRMNDPQTAHHNFDFPVALQDVERIEILHGPGSDLYGADAMSGTINIITKKQAANSGELYGGDFALAGGYVSLGGSKGQLYNRVSTLVSRSDGYMENTDFRAVNVLYNAAFTTPAARISFLSGYCRKKFGANSFYSSAFPNEREQTATTLAVLRVEQIKTAFLWTPQLSWKRHFDDFILDNQRPDWNRSRHTGNTLTLELPVFLQIGGRLFSFGGTMQVETLHSSNLGDHERSRGSLYFALQQNMGRNFILNTSVNTCYYPQYGWNTWPAQDIAWRLNDYLKLYATAARSFRMPSFTELYYHSPANVGNPSLKYSQAVSLEGGLDWQAAGYYSHLALFSRRGENMIDWARKNVTEPWQVMNDARQNTLGLEIMVRVVYNGRLPSVLHCGWMLLNTGKATPGYLSKYLFNSIKYQLTLGGDQALPCQLGVNWQVKHTKRQASMPYTVADIALFRPLWSCNVYVKISNIFSANYYEVTGVPMAGRWFSAGLKYDL